MIKEALYYQRGIRGKEAEKELLILEKRELSKEEKEEFIKKWGGIYSSLFCYRLSASPVTEEALPGQSFSLWRKRKGSCGII